MSASLSTTKLGHLVGAPLSFAARSYGDFDVIHAHGDSYLIFGRRTGLVRTYYGTAKEEARHAERLRRRLSQQLLFVGERISRETSTVTVGISENTARALGGLDDVIPCGVDLDRFHPGAKSVHPSILFVGTLRGRKRGHLVLEAFAEQVRPRFPDAELWFVGDETVTGEGVVARGQVSDEEIAKLFREAWVFTLPSTYEGFGVPYIEAMASGTAVVATDNAGAREVVSERGGLIVDDTGLGVALVGLLTDDERRQELAAGGRKEAARFGWANVAERYEDVYRLAMNRAAQ